MGYSCMAIIHTVGKIAKSQIVFGPIVGLFGYLVSLALGKDVIIVNVLKIDYTVGDVCGYERVIRCGIVNIDL